MRGKILQVHAVGLSLFQQAPWFMLRSCLFYYIYIYLLDNASTATFVQGAVSSSCQATWGDRPCRRCRRWCACRYNHACGMPIGYTVAPPKFNMEPNKSHIHYIPLQITTVCSLKKDRYIFWRFHVEYRNDGLETHSWHGGPCWSSDSPGKSWASALHSRYKKRSPCGKPSLRGSPRYGSCDWSTIAAVINLPWCSWADCLGFWRFGFCWCLQHGV